MIPVISWLKDCWPISGHHYPIPARWRKKKAKDRRIRGYVYWFYPFSKAFSEAHSTTSDCHIQLKGRLGNWVFELSNFDGRNRLGRSGLWVTLGHPAHSIFQLGHSKCSMKIYILWNNPTPCCDTQMSHLFLPYPHLILCLASLASRANNFSSVKTLLILKKFCLQITV